MRRLASAAPWALALLVTFAACRSTTTIVAANPASAPHTVLFVGNSFTYYNNGLNNHYRELVRAAHGSDWKNRVRIMAISGGKLFEHRDGLAQRLASQEFDAVVLQGHSKEPLNQKDRFVAAVTEYVDWIRASGARPALFMTWAYEGEPEMTDKLATAYESVGKDVGALVVPVGRAFARVTAERPGLRLRTEDGKHPTVHGTYLTACTMFAALHGRSPVGLAYRADLPETEATYLQEAAWAVLQDHLAR